MHSIKCVLNNCYPEFGLAQDASGTLEGSELSAFVRDLLATGGKEASAHDISDLEKVILKACDLDRNGTIDGKELALVIKSIANAKQKGMFKIRKKNNFF